MEKLPRKTEPRQAERSSFPVPATPDRLPERTGAADALPDAPPPGFVWFRYSSTEIDARGQQVQVRMKRADYRDGRMRTEECEGVLDPLAHRRAVQQAQAEAIGQFIGLARSLLAPFFTRNR
jgi:hypothetical protein